MVVGLIKDIVNDFEVESLFDFIFELNNSRPKLSLNLIAEKSGEFSFTGLFGHLNKSSVSGSLIFSPVSSKLLIKFILFIDINDIFLSFSWAD